MSNLTVASFMVFLKNVGVGPQEDIYSFPNVRNLFTRDSCNNL